jgi:hypothetical protein
MKKILLPVLIGIITIISIIPTFATTEGNPSPSAKQQYTIIVNNNRGGTGSYTSITNKDEKYIILKAKTKKGYVFEYWVIDGKYVLIDGDLNSSKLKISLQGDCTATPYFRNKKTSQIESVSLTKNTSSTSPKTGETEEDNLYFLWIIAVAIVTNGGLLLVYKQYKKPE